MSQQPPGQPYYGRPNDGEPPHNLAPRPVSPVSVSRPPSSDAVPRLLGVIAFLLAALLATAIIQMTPSRPSRLSPGTRDTVQAAYDTSNKTLATIETDFKTSVFYTPSTDSAIKQQVAEQQYLFEMQVLIAQQNKAMLKALLDS